MSFSYQADERSASPSGSNISRFSTPSSSDFNTSSLSRSSTLFNRQRDLHGTSPSLESLRLKYPAVQQLYLDYQERDRAANGFSTRLLSLLDHIERLTEEKEKLKQTLVDLDGIYKFHPSLRSTQPQKRPADYPFEILWDMDDCKLDPLATPSNTNPSRPYLSGCIRQVDGTNVSKQELDAMKATAGQAFTKHLSQFREPLLKIKKGPRGFNSSVLRTHQPEAWTKAVQMVEEAHPLVALCRDHWKATQLLQYNIQNAAASTAKRDKRRRKGKGKGRAKDSDSDHESDSDLDDDVTNNNNAGGANIGSNSPPLPTSLSSQSANPQSVLHPPAPSDTPIDPALLELATSFAAQNSSLSSKRKEPEPDGDESGLPLSSSPKRLRTRDDILTDDINLSLKALERAPVHIPAATGSHPHSVYLKIVPTQENLQEILQSDFPQLKTAGVQLLHKLGRLPPHPPSHQPANEVVNFISRIESADPQDTTISEDDTNQSWGHYQFTGGSMTITSVLTTWDSVGYDAALRLIAAAIKTCRVSRHLCFKRSIMPTSYLSDTYLQLVLEQLEALVEKAGSTPNDTSGEDDAPGDLVCMPATLEMLMELHVAELKIWIEENHIKPPTKQRPLKKDLVDAIIKSTIMPSQKRVSEFKGTRAKKH